VWSHPAVGGSFIWIIIAAMFYFPKLALGLSGFETGVVVMPLVKSDVEAPRDEIKALHATRVDEGDASPDAQAHLAGRIRNGKKLLAGAAIIMSFYLIGSSIVTAMLIPYDKIQEGGEANGRAISYPVARIPWTRIRYGLSTSRRYSYCGSQVHRQWPVF
jgi:hypothetical protein